MKRNTKIYIVEGLMLAVLAYFLVPLIFIEEWIARIQFHLFVIFIVSSTFLAYMEEKYGFEDVKE